MTTLIWVILAIGIVLLIVYIAGGRKKDKRVITESREKFPENKSTPRSAP
jgi:hypothetical protein